MEKYFKILGYLVKDTVTNRQGIVTSISFDLSGCVQGLVTPVCDREGKTGDSYWIDTKRLVPLAKTPVMSPPSFKIIPGGQDLPKFQSKPTL